MKYIFWLRIVSLQAYNELNGNSNEWRLGSKEGVHVVPGQLVTKQVDTEDQI